jgi:hypothetical protein
MLRCVRRPDCQRDHCYDVCLPRFEQRELPSGGTFIGGLADTRANNFARGRDLCVAAGGYHYASCFRNTGVLHSRRIHAYNQFKGIFRSDFTYGFRDGEGDRGRQRRYCQSGGQRCIYSDVADGDTHDFTRSRDLRFTTNGYHHAGCFGNASLLHSRRVYADNQFKGIFRSDFTYSFRDGEGDRGRQRLHCQFGGHRCIYGDVADACTHDFTRSRDLRFTTNGYHHAGCFGNASLLHSRRVYAHDEFEGVFRSDFTYGFCDGEGDRGRQRRRCQFSGERCIYSDVADAGTHDFTRSRDLLFTTSGYHHAGCFGNASLLHSRRVYADDQFEGVFRSDFTYCFRDGEGHRSRQRRHCQFSGKQRIYTAGANRAGHVDNDDGN